MPDDLTVEELAAVIQLAVRLRLERGMERNLAVVEAERVVRDEQRRKGEHDATR